MAFINEDVVYDRIKALESFIESFPDSPLISPMKNELNHLYTLGVVSREGGTQ